MADTKIADLTDGTSLFSTDQLVVNRGGSDRRVVASAASDTVVGIIELAIQSEMETGTDVVRAVVPGRQQHHKSACKFWVYWTGGSTTILDSYNVASIDNDATGDAGINLTTGFSGNNFAAFVQTNDTTNGWDNEEVQASGINVHTASVVDVLCSTITDGTTAAAALNNPDQYQACGFGDQ